MPPNNDHGHERISWIKEAYVIDVHARPKTCEIVSQHDLEQNTLLKTLMLEHESIYVQMENRRRICQVLS